MFLLDHRVVAVWNLIIFPLVIARKRARHIEPGDTFIVVNMAIRFKSTGIVQCAHVDFYQLTEFLTIAFPGQGGSAVSTEATVYTLG